LLYLSSEESAIRLVCPDLDEAWIPAGGEPVVGSLKTPRQTQPVAVAGASATLPDSRIVSR